MHVFFIIIKLPGYKTSAIGGNMADVSFDLKRESAER